MLQDMYQTLPFKDAGRMQFQRFMATDQIRLIQAIFKKEFNIDTLIENNVVYEHFMPHTNKKHEILESLRKNSWALTFNMIKFSETFLDHMEPINLIADYFGEKYALYMAFMFHHLGWLILPGIVGTALFLFHIYNGIKFKEEGDTVLESYSNAVDSPWNYLYIIFITLWSTAYLESWKRKHATISYVWGLEERKDQIERSVKLKQSNTEYVFNE